MKSILIIFFYDFHQRVMYFSQSGYFPSYVIWMLISVNMNTLLTGLQVQTETCYFLVMTVINCWCVREETWHDIAKAGCHYIRYNLVFCFLFHQNDALSLVMIDGFVVCVCVCVCTNSVNILHVCVCVCVFMCSAGYLSNRQTDRHTQTAISKFSFMKKQSTFDKRQLYWQ